MTRAVAREIQPWISETAQTILAGIILVNVDRNSRETRIQAINGGLRFEVPTKFGRVIIELALRIERLKNATKQPYPEKVAHRQKMIDFLHHRNYLPCVLTGSGVPLAEFLTSCFLANSHDPATAPQ